MSITANLSIFRAIYCPLLDFNTQCIFCGMYYVRTLYNTILRIARNFLETRENIKISTHPFYLITLDWFSWEWSKKNFSFFEKKIQNGRLKKSSFFKIANSQNFFTKISQIRPWVSRIEWCEKMHFRHFFAVFELLSDSLTAIYVELHQCPSHHSILLTQWPIWEIFAKKKYWELAILKNELFFEQVILNFFFQKKKFFLLHSHENQFIG